MITTFSNLGKYGRMGNALFQAAATIGHAKLHGDDYLLPSSWEHKDHFDLNYSPNIPKLKAYEEQGFHYSPINARNVDLKGYFQSEKYFEHCKDFIREKLSPRPLAAYERRKDICSIHVRRTDYLNFSEYHTNLSMDYYLNAMAKMKGCSFLVFSDDTEWCKEHFYGLAEVAPVADAMTDFCSMISCDHNIIANSSFSWWAAWLNPNKDKKVIAPSNWFGPKYSHNTKDLYPVTWETI